MINKASIATSILALSVSAFADQDLSEERNYVTPAIVGTGGDYRSFQETEDQVSVLAGARRNVTVSNTDLNLIVCESGDIQDKAYSTEKPMSFDTKPEINGAIGYLKFKKKVEPNGDEQLYTKEAELYITCGGEIFSLQLVPAEIKGRQILLSSGKRKSMQENVGLFKELDMEDAAMTLIDKVQFETVLPDSFTVNSVANTTQWKAIKPSIHARQIKTVKPEGVGLALHEYLVHASDATQFNEYDFAKLHLNTLAIRISNLTMDAKGTTRVYIVERIWR